MTASIVGIGIDTAARPMLPPMAIISLNNRAVLIAQAEEFEHFAAIATSPEVREALWRTAAALRVSAYLMTDDPGRFAAYAVYIDGDRAKDARGEGAR